MEKSPAPQGGTTKCGARKRPRFEGAVVAVISSAEIPEKANPNFTRTNPMSRRLWAPCPSCENKEEQPGYVKTSKPCKAPPELIEEIAPAALPPYVGAVPFSPGYPKTRGVDLRRHGVASLHLQHIARLKLDTIIRS